MAAAVEPALFSRVSAEAAQPPPLPVADLAPALPPHQALIQAIPQVAEELETDIPLTAAELPPAQPDPVLKKASELDELQTETSAEPVLELLAAFARQVRRGIPGTPSRGGSEVSPPPPVELLAESTLAEPKESHAETSPDAVVELPEPLTGPVAQESKQFQGSRAEVSRTPAAELIAEQVAQETKQFEESRAEASPEAPAELPEPPSEPGLQEPTQLAQALPEPAAELTAPPAEESIQTVGELPEPLPDPVLQQAKRLQQSEAEASTEPLKELPEPPAEPVMQPSEQFQELQAEVTPEPVAKLPELPMNPLLQLAQQLLGEREPALAQPSPGGEAGELTTPAFPALPLLELEAPPAAVALLAAPAEEPLAEPELSAAAVMPAPRTMPRVPPPVSLASPTPLSASLGATSGKPVVDSSSIATGPALALGPMQDYGAVALRKIQAVAPVRRILTPDAGPRITLPGPALPPPLHSLTNAGISAVIGSRSRAARKSTGNWMVSSLTAVLMFAGVLGVLFALPHFGSEPKSATPAAAVVAPNEVEAATPPPVTYPLSKSVEVTGFRFLNDASKKPEVHYLVVNHSNTEMPPVTVYVSLRSSAAKPGQPPLCRFSFRASGLGAFEAKEMTSVLDKLPRPADWQDLQAEVALGQ